ncbi:MAG TPA: amino acid ABC transporter substrate-binding protein [Trueperaceae bacterium]
MFKIFKAVTLLTLILTLVSGALAQGESRLDMVKERGHLICGVHNAKPGFGGLNEQGVYAGFDTDFCRAVAAAIFDDPTKVEFVPLTSSTRFTAIQSGEVDVVFRSTTRTSTRDAGADFGPVNFYDGQGVMVRADLPVEAITDLEGAVICTAQGSTSEQNITDYMRARDVPFELVTYQDFDRVMSAFEEGRCDAFTSDRSVLVSRKATSSDPSEYRILPETISKEPLAPFVAQNDSVWLDAISWIVFATINAEELGITQENVGSFADTDNPKIRRFLGLEGDTGERLGLAPDFAARVIRAEGNYGEIYNRHLGPDTAFDLPRGINSLYTEGGLMYSPPFR